MEDKQIIELFYNRSEKAIPEMQEKYGQECAYIASHILPSADEAEVCAKESLQVLWETIPPHRPQNLKAYVCKITRNHALQMKYPDFMEQDVDLFSAELVIHDFLKELEPEQRKLFIANYWYFATVAEIATQYKISEKKVNTVLLSMRQKLDNALEEKQISFISEEELFFAMTEVEDCYLEEAEPLKIVPKETSEEIGQDENQNTAILFSQMWKKYKIPAIACIVLLFFVVLIWPKNSEEQKPTESDSEDYLVSETESEEDEIDDDWYGGERLTAEDFQNRMNALPWNESMQIGALPIYKNLAYHTNEDGEYIGHSYYDEDTLSVMAQAIAEQLNMQVNKSYFYMNDTNVVQGIVAETPEGEIRIDGNGIVNVTFADGVQLPKEYQMSTIANTEKANDTVMYLLEYYQALWQENYRVSACYPSYDLEGNCRMHYRAVGTGYGTEGILEHYFNQVDFYYNNQKGLTGLRFGDSRAAAQNLGYYPVISLEEAKALLLEGKCKNYFIELRPDEYDESMIQGVELMYHCREREEYFQPYYRFYLKKEDSNVYHSFYVPAIRGVDIDIMLPPEHMIEILDVGSVSAKGDLVYCNEEQFYQVNHMQVNEVDTYTFKTTLTLQDVKYEIELLWCKVEDEIYAHLKGDLKHEFEIEMIPGCTDKVLLVKYLSGIEEIFLCDLSRQEISFLLNTDTVNARYINSISVSENMEYIILNTEKNEIPLLYNGSEVIDLSEVIAEETGDELTAKFIEDKVLISDITYTDGWIYYISSYVYDIEHQMVECIINNEKRYSENTDPNGNYLSGGRYVTRVDEANTIEIIDLLDGSSVKTEYKDSGIQVYDASPEYFAFVHMTGEIFIIEKISGKIIDSFDYQFNFTPSKMTYKNNMLYIEDWSGRCLVYVLTHFE